MRIKPVFVAVVGRWGVGGVAAWRLGDEAPKFWDAIGRYARGD